MTVADLFEQVDMQGEIKIVYVKEIGVNYERVAIERERAEDLEIEYMYCDDGVLYVEVKYEEEE